MLRKILRLADRLFKRKKRVQLTEEYIFNERYIDNPEIIQFIQRIKQKPYCSSYRINILVRTGDFSEEEYGEVMLLKNGKIIEKAKLLKGDNGLIFWSFL